MAHGENTYPLEAEDGGPVSVVRGKDRRELATGDRSAQATLEELLSVNKKILMALQILIEQEIPDED